MKKYLICFLLIIVFYSCGKDKTVPGNGYDPNKPSFRAGSTWTYHYTFYLADGSIGSEDEISTQIIKDTTINGSKYFVTGSNYYFTNKNDGYYEYDRYTNQENLIYKNPATTSDTYQGTYLTMPPSNCVRGFNAQVGNTDTSYMYNSKQYDKLISYTFNIYSLSCQSQPAYTKDLFSKKMGLKIQTVSYNGFTPTLSSKIDLKSFTY